MFVRHQGAMHRDEITRQYHQLFEDPAYRPGMDMGTDTFVVRDGKIVYQTFGAHITPRG